MKNSQTQIFSERNLARNITLGAAIIGIMALSSMLTGLVSANLSLELAATGLAVLISTACLLHIYHEHHQWTKLEQKLTTRVIRKMQTEYSHLPALGVLQTHLCACITDLSSPQLRIDTLRNLTTNRQALDEFILKIQREQAEIDVLEDLGLRWGEPSNHSEYAKRA